MIFTMLTLVCFISATSFGESLSKKPNIIIAIADDMGWGDVGFTSKPEKFNIDVPEAPHLNRLASDGIVLDNFYTQAACSPSRASLMTGKYAYKLGQLFASSVLRPKESRVPTDRFITEELADMGYKVHGVGKWHLGNRSSGLPIQKGFHSFYGIYQGMGTYYSHRHVSHSFKDGIWHDNYGDYDFHYDYKNSTTLVYTDIHKEAEGIHATQLYTTAAIERISNHNKSSPLFLYIAYTAPHSPLEPDEDTVENRNKHISDTERRKYAALVTQMDDGFGAIMSTLKRRGMMGNTVVMYLSDHGAPIKRDCWDYAGGTNLPYRDGKFTFFEGGIKSAAFIWTPWLSDDIRGTHSPALVHIVDVYSLVLSMANDEGTLTSLFNYPESDEERDAGAYLLQILQGNNTGRETILHNLVTSVPHKKKIKYCTSTLLQPDSYSVIRHRQYKLFHGDLWDWCASDLLAEPCPDPLNLEGDAVMLFDIEEDPYETVNIARYNLDIVDMLLGLVGEYAKNATSQWVV